MVSFSSLAEKARGVVLSTLFIEFTAFSNAADYFSDVLPCKSLLGIEFMKLKKQLTIAVTWAVTSYEYEWSFRGWRRLNTCLQATQISEGPESLALIHIEKVTSTT